VLYKLLNNINNNVDIPEVFLCSMLKMMILPSLDRKYCTIYKVTIFPFMISNALFFSFCVIAKKMVQEKKNEE